MNAQPDMTQLIVESRNGSSDARDALFERAYGELREHARRQRRGWHGDLTLDTTALVNEAYLKLVRQEDHSWENRTHFFSVAARAMRHILINYARAQSAQKRGGEVKKISLEQMRDILGREIAMTDERAEILVVLDEALDELATRFPRACQVVECRFFGGMSIPETAEALETSTATVSRDWKLAQAWLYRHIKEMED